MSKVFTWHEIETGSIPRRKGFQAVGAMLCQELATASCVTGALIYGSFLRGDYNKRSDIDVLMIYPYRQHDGVVELQQRLQLAAQARFVPIRIIAVDIEMAMAGDHTFFPMYYEHLCVAARIGGIVKEDPIQFVLPKMTTFQEEAQGYLARKSSNFDRSMEALPIATEEQLVTAIGKALSFPIHAARKTLQCLAPKLLAEGDSKSAVAAFYPRLGIPGTVDVFFELIGLDRMYAEALTEQQDRPDADRYGLLLERLKSAIALAHRLARLNLRALRSSSVTR